jgi:hypothetical protein
MHDPVALTLEDEHSLPDLTDDAAADLYGPKIAAAYREVLAGHERQVENLLAVAGVDGRGQCDHRPRAVDRIR